MGKVWWRDRLVVGWVLMLAWGTELCLAQTDSSNILTNRKYSLHYGFGEKPPKPLVKEEGRKKYPPGGLFSGSAGTLMGRLVYFDENTGEYDTRFRGALVSTLNVHLYKELVLSGTFFYNINTKNQPPLPIWVSDMFYSVKWTNWRPYTFSFGYENYADNRYNEPARKWGEKFLQGYAFVSFNANLPAKWIDKIRLDESTNFVFVPTIRYFPSYRNPADDILYHRLMTSVAARYTIWKRIYVEAGAFYYPMKDTRMPWDPDFTYGFGYFDFRPWRLSVTYGNWIANRYSFNKEIPKYNFLDGNFNILFNYRF